MTKNTQENDSVAFTRFGLHPDILKAVQKTGYLHATPIQAQAIPVVLDGRDVMGAAQTGTGKTAAFSLPILHRVMPFASHSTSPAKHPVRALILTPTRELADQVYENVLMYSSESPLKVAVVYGGVDITPQKNALRQGCEILIATPGRLLDHLEQKNVNLSHVSVFVLDEADRMLDMGFMPDLERIVSHLPKVRQNLMFSATFSPEIRKLARSLLNHPVEITVAAKNATADTVHQIAYHVLASQKNAALLYLLKSKYVDQVIVFANTKLAVSRTARFLQKEGVKAESIHGDKSQLERQKTLDAFKEGKINVLVATDVAARGLDVAGLPCVINLDLPYNPEDYVHRIGRTGRAGSKGEAVALYCDADEKHLAGIEALIKIKIPLLSLKIPAVFVEHASPSSNNKYPSKGVGRAFTHARLTPLDDFFYRPYVPDESVPAKAPNLKQIIVRHDQFTESRHAETMLPVLLGGKPKTSN